MYRRHKWADEAVTLCACRDLLGCERGAWCGSCLWTRMGQNIHEVAEDPAWRCPPCLDLCNCSGLGCTRCRAGWAPTGILNKEHHDAGFKSVRPKPSINPGWHARHAWTCAPAPA